ncbi:MAG: Cof-type HAD-IIB family hydrolase [Bacteroidales bacterium]|nr:Cof-type HAD-IIB family hydrolase [Bacteroidales bacterium]
MIKAAFFDIDGTLLSFKTHIVSTGTVAAFQALQRLGVRTFISSGRPTRLIPSFPFRFDGYITMNGGYCYLPSADGSVAGRKVLLSNPIPQHLSDRWLRYADDNGVVTFAFTDDKLYLNRMDEATAALQRQLDFEMPPVKPAGEMMGMTVYQFIVMQPPADDAKVLAMLPQCRMPRWHPAFSDLIADGNSKAAGMQAIIDHFGIRQEETIAFGDGENDIEMLDFAGVGVAMGNANDNVKAHADMVTTSVDDEGIQRALLRLGIG